MWTIQPFKMIFDRCMKMQERGWGDGSRDLLSLVLSTHAGWLIAAISRGPETLFSPPLVPHLCAQPPPLHTHT